MEKVGRGFGGSQECLCEREAGCSVLGDVKKMCPAYVRLGGTSRDELVVKGGNAVHHGCHSESCAWSLIDDDDYMTTLQCVSKPAPFPLLLPLVTQFAFPPSLTFFPLAAESALSILPLMSKSHHQTQVDNLLVPTHTLFPPLNPPSSSQLSWLKGLWFGMWVRGGVELKMSEPNLGQGWAGGRVGS